MAMISLRRVFFGAGAFARASVCVVAIKTPKSRGQIF
jgi:hypothetical protein